MATALQFGDGTNIASPLHDNYLEVRRMFEVLSLFEAPYLEEKLLSKNKVSSPEDYQEAFSELKKYLVLCHVYGGGLGMISERVDDVWHQFILFTREYQAFSKQYFGRYFHHRPNLMSAPIEPKSGERFVALYREHFGALPKIWKVCGHDEVATTDGASCAHCNACMGCMGSGCMGCGGGGGGN